MAWSKTKKVVVAGLVLILAAGTATVLEKKELPRSESIARLDQAKQWALAFILFAEAHGNQLPNSFEQAKAYAPALSDSNWEIVRSGDERSFVDYSKTVLLREKEPKQSANGKFVKVYAFADGHAELISSLDRDFTAMEKQRGFLIRPPKN
jgi:prepilin-type processing-associated H-X9-DG protein